MVIAPDPPAGAADVGGAVPVTERGISRAWRSLLVAVVAGALLLLLPVMPAVSAPGPAQGQQQGQGQGQTEEPQQEAPPVWTGVPGTNLAHETYGYAWPAAPDCDESDVGTGGCVNDGLGFFQGQCTSWVAHRLNQRNGIAFSNWYDGVHWGNAADWARVAKGLGYQRNRVPAVGAVGWYARGHVSYVEEVNDDGSIVISEMNTDGHNGFHLVTVVPGGVGWPDRFIHLADVVPVDTTAPERPAPVGATTLPRAVEVSWQPPADDLGVTGYRVLRNGMPLAETTEPAYVDRQASPGQVYAYSVEAYDAAGNVSEPATVVRGQGVPAPARSRDRLQDAVLVESGAATVVCGRLGTRDNQRVGCRLRTLDGWRTVRTGREVPWGKPATRVFVATDDARIWFCREVGQDRNGCLPLDLTSLSWGFDRVDTARPRSEAASWLVTPAGPARCGIVGDRPSCSVLGESGWERPRRAVDVRPGDPLSRAFVAVERGVAFCRNIEGRAACTSLGARKLQWGRTVVTGRNLDHGRWVARPAGPALCPVGGAECLVVSRPRA
jgi:hypothetical protein